MKNELETTKYSFIEQDSNTATSNSTTLTIGMTLDGTYEIRREIARGGMGIVYEAYHNVFNKKVAIKIILPITIDSLQLKRFQKEVRAYSNLSHPNIIHIYNVGIYENTPYIVMDYIDGVNICQYVAQHDENYRKQKLHNAGLGIKRDWKLCVKLIYETALALEYIHKQKMIHRDIKPSNIIVRSDGTPIIIDLGLVKFQSEKFTSLTQSGELLGTLSYMPIEQAKGKHGRIDARCDIYSLGLVLYELLTGEMAYSGENILEISYKIMSYYPPLPSNFNPQIPEALEKITMRAIDKKKENRYATAQEFADELKKYLDNENAQETRKNNDYKKQLLLQGNKRISVKWFIALYLLFGFLSIEPTRLPQPDRSTYNGVIKDSQKVFEHCEKLANNGDKNAQYKLADMYYWGNGTKRDYKKAFEYYEKASKQGHKNAQYKLADMYYNGRGVERDCNNAIYWYEKAANQGDINSQSTLAKLYYEGIVVERDYDKAIYWYEKAANQGDINSQSTLFKLANMYYNGKEVERDYKKARELYGKLAYNDNISDRIKLYSQTKLGNIYHYILKDRIAAQHLYEEATQQGYIDAQYYLGLLYYEIGRKSELEEACKWLEKAASKGHEEAKKLLNKIKQLQK